MSLPGVKSSAEFFADFNIRHATYKTVNNHSIDLSILAPKKLPPGQRPVIVRFHGGGLVTGTRLHTGWFAPWIRRYALTHSAIIVTPDHRLLPESRGADILDDLASFWTWLLALPSLPTYLSTHLPGTASVSAALDRILCVGESAGGWLAVQSSFLLRPALGRIAATIAISPMLDLRAPHFTRRYEKRIVGLPMLDEELIDEYVAAAKARPGGVVSSVTPPERMDLFVAILQHGRFEELLGLERALYPVERVEEWSGGFLPPLLVMHGVDDSVVPVEGSKRFVEAWKKCQSGSKVELVLRPGEHGFDATADIQDEWLREALGPITGAWLGEP